jgi:D-alanyl-D-alanine carboxypeptidase
MKQRVVTRKIRTIFIVAAALLTIAFAAAMVLLLPKQSTAPKAPAAHTNAPTKKQEPAKEQAKPADSFNKTTYSTSDTSSLWVIVNKQHPLSPVSYAPSDLKQGLNGYVYSSRIQADLSALIAAASTQSVALSLVSAYRSYDTQVSVYNGYVRSYGQATADTISARPGYSEHQTGLAVDIGSTSDPSCNLNECFGTTAAGQWLAAHTTDYGFVIRYQKDTTATTGYSYEPWHIRYIGREAASEYKKEGATSLEQFFGVSGGNYAN